jgi:hypothetical protein
MDGARVGEQPHDRGEHLLELERRADGRDQLGEEPALDLRLCRRFYVPKGTRKAS